MQHYIALLVDLWTNIPCAQHNSFFEGGELSHSRGGGLTTDVRRPPKNFCFVDGGRAESLWCSAIALH